MGFIEITITAVLIWVIVFGILKLFSLRENSWVVTLMDYYGLSISLGYLNWYTTSFNSMFIYLGSKHPRFFQLWFSAGIAAGFTCSLIGLGVLIYTILSKLFQPEEPPLLTPVLPGVNVPSNQLLYYFTSLLIAGVFHEMGHAIAAVRERIRVKGFGVFMLLMYPGAYVDFRDEFDSLTTIQQLRIYCAGVWHNVVLTAIAIGIISSMNTIMFPFYKPTEGVMITDISMGSPLRGSLYEGDLITAIGDCPVYDRLSWRNCIEYLMSDQYALRGFCVSKTQIQNAEKNNQFGCCNNPETANPSLQCFERQVNEKPQNICLTAREVVNERGFCFIDKDCEPYKTTEPKYCVKVSQTTSYANELIKISLKGSTPSVIFVGHPSLLFYELQVSDFSPRQFFAFLSPTFPLIIEELCEYIASISAALALLNMVPVFYLDGQWAWLGFVKLLFPHVTEENREKWCKYINIGSSALLILALLISLTAVL